MIKNKIIILGVLLFLSCNCAQYISGKIVDKKGGDHSVIKGPEWINFVWKGDSIGGRYFEYAYMYVPINIENLDYEFSAQLDLAAYTAIYGNSINPYLVNHPELASKLDTSNKYKIDDIDCGEFNRLKIYQKKSLLGISDALYYKKYGDTVTSIHNNTSTLIHIGTIGVDLFSGKILIIDYPNNRISVLDSLIAPYSNENFVKCRQDDNGRIILPLKVGLKEYSAMFDTGSSIFSLVSNSNFWSDNCDTSVIDEFQVPAWGKKKTIYGASLKHEVFIGNKKMAKNLCYKAPLLGNSFKNEIGIIGNKWFMNSIVIVDFQTSQFAIVN